MYGWAKYILSRALLRQSLELSSRKHFQTYFESLNVLLRWPFYKLDESNTMKVGTAPKLDLEQMLENILGRNTHLTRTKINIIVNVGDNDVIIG